MSAITERALLFLDVDGPLIPFGAPPARRADGSPLVHETAAGSANPLLDRLNPEHGPRLRRLPCDLVWATTWMADANEVIAPRLGLPELPVVTWPDEAEDDTRLHWKTRGLVDWAAGRPFVWVDDEITEADRVWVDAHHGGPALLLRVDPRIGLSAADFAVVEDWLEQC
ncbi:HAD domain-containing protein [Catellatospora sp. NPDC049609]|uniref:HAD domain-containing protein n=1 Tax=Catellatospora sp. NPDC049609 TaxID=3155505 RepID=UPI003431A22A